MFILCVYFTNIYYILVRHITHYDRDTRTIFTHYNFDRNKGGCVVAAEQYHYDMRLSCHIFDLVWTMLV